MVTDHIFGGREDAIEAGYFRNQDAKLLEALRQNARLDDIAKALRDKLGLDNPDLLAAARELGITADTAAAFLLAPQVQVAWAGGSMTKNQREAVLRHARARGMEETSPGYSQLTEWLQVKPSDAFFDTALKAIRHGLTVLPAKEADERIERILDACRQIASSSGDAVIQVMGMGFGGGVSTAKAAMVKTISDKLRRPEA